MLGRIKTLDRLNKCRSRRGDEEEGFERAHLLTSAATVLLKPLQHERPVGFAQNSRNSRKDLYPCESVSIRGSNRRVLAQKSKRPGFASGPHTLCFCCAGVTAEIDVLIIAHPQQGNSPHYGGQGPFSAAALFKGFIPERNGEVVSWIGKPSENLYVTETMLVTEKQGLGSTAKLARLIRPIGPLFRTCDILVRIEALQINTHGSGLFLVFHYVRGCSFPCSARTLLRGRLYPTPVFKKSKSPFVGTGRFHLH
jgi:hypothetical protein